jgi:hypothetical protein
MVGDAVEVPLCDRHVVQLTPACDLLRDPFAVTQVQTTIRELFSTQTKTDHKRRSTLRPNSIKDLEEETDAIRRRSAVVVYSVVTEW